MTVCFRQPECASWLHSFTSPFICTHIHRDTEHRARDGPFIAEGHYRSVRDINKETDNYEEPSVVH